MGKEAWLGSGNTVAAPGGSSCGVPAILSSEAPCSFIPQMAQLVLRPQGHPSSTWLKGSRGRAWECVGVSIHWF